MIGCCMKLMVVPGRIEGTFRKECTRAYAIEKIRNVTRQDGVTVSAYFTKLRRIWDEINTVLLTPRCTCNGCKCEVGKKLVELKEKERLIFLLRSKKPRATGHPQAIHGCTFDDKGYWGAMDSGATDHMIYQKEVLGNVTTNENETPITVANEIDVPVKGNGEVFLKGGIKIRHVKFIEESFPFSGNDPNDQADHQEISKASEKEFEDWLKGGNTPDWLKEGDTPTDEQSHDEPKNFQQAS
ncbi:hypothetical protein Tco_1204385 [Tanacetum coccineum]